MARAATTSDVFNAIAEPQRRRVLSLLRQREYPATHLATALNMSQPTASKHLRVLRQVGLVRVRKTGKARVYRLDANGLRPISEWVGGFEQFWTETFSRLDTYVQQLRERSDAMEAVERESASDRELVVSHTIHAPRELVFEAYTSATHLDQWFGPAGIRTITRALEFRPGGVWEFTMHADDGTDFPNWVQWLEIVPPERILYQHGERADDPRMFVSTLTLVERSGVTEITLHAIFKTREQRDFVVERFNALEAGKQTLAKLAAYVEQLKTHPDTKGGLAT
jgi:uncharacterized protein YndB with AHSA1/START domain/DNA-binding transcriptional ArsR family regulator